MQYKVPIYQIKADYTIYQIGGQRHCTYIKYVRDGSAAAHCSQIIRAAFAAVNISTREALRRSHTVNYFI